MLKLDQIWQLQHKNSKCMKFLCTCTFFHFSHLRFPFAPPPWGVSRRSQTGGLSESLILAPWSKVKEWCPHRKFGAPEVFFPGAPPGHPCLCLNGTYLSCWFIFFFLATFLSLFFHSFSFPFLFLNLFGTPLLTRGGPKAPPGYAPAPSLWMLMLVPPLYWGGL